tara:strand:- start:1 stop:384 length:384 start_codon:yes stop_codon:yes gene_type:complete
MQINVHDAVDTVEVLPAVRRTATANGSAVDIQQYVGKLKFVLATSAGGGTSPTLDVKLQDSADGSTGWADISGAAFTQVTDAADATADLGIWANAVKRYVRAVVTISGTSPTFDCALVAVGTKQVRA